MAQYLPVAPRALLAAAVTVTQRLGVLGVLTAKPHGPHVAPREGAKQPMVHAPLLITAPEQDRFWPGQSQQLYDRLPGSRQLVRFTTHEGAGQHCEPLALALRETRIFDWLDQHLA